MNKMNLFLAAGMLLACSAVVCEARSGVDEVGPYTVETISANVWHIMDCNSERPAGAFVDKDGKAGFNNISDMYLINGDKQALLIDLSNKITWAENADKYLRKVVESRIGKRDLIVTVTHAHGDHTGMVGAFADDPAVKFLLPAADFFGSRSASAFPMERTTYFDEGYRIDLGKGVVLNTLTVAGHTKGSTVFFLEGEDMCFSGDAIGSGNGTWIFDYESLRTYALSVPRLKKYINLNNIDTSRLVFYGGHSHQKGNLHHLGMQYLDDMILLIEMMKANSAASETVNFNRLNRNYNYGQAWITVNDQDAARFAEDSKR